MYSGFWPSARLKCVLRGTSCPSLELPRPAEVAHSRRSCEGGLFSLLNGCFCFRGVCAGGRFPFLPLLSPSHSHFFSFPPIPAPHSPLNHWSSSPLSLFRPAARPLNHLSAGLREEEELGRRRRRRCGCTVAVK